MTKDVNEKLARYVMEHARKEISTKKRFSISAKLENFKS